MLLISVLVGGIWPLGQIILTVIWNCVQRWQERTDALWKILICLEYPMI